MSAKKSAVKKPFVRIDDKRRENIIAFVRKGNTNAEAKERFGVSAHFVGKLRREAGISASVSPTVVKKASPAAKAVAAVKKSAVAVKPKKAPVKAVAADADVL